MIAPIRNDVGPVITIKVQRQNGPTATPAWQTFEVPYKPGHNVISLLQAVAAAPLTVEGEHVEPPVWEASCLEEVCGSCTMLVNGHVRQACSALVDDLLGLDTTGAGPGGENNGTARVQGTEHNHSTQQGSRGRTASKADAQAAAQAVQAREGDGRDRVASPSSPPPPRDTPAALRGDHRSVGTITLSPMTKFPVVRDLWVDRQRMFDALAQVKAWVPIDGTHDLGPGPTELPDKQEERYALSRCMTCGCCLEACPQFQIDNDFIGPQAIGQAHYFNLHDTGKQLKADRLEALMGPGGVTDCGNAQNCVKVCPKEVPLTEAIAKIGRGVTLHTIKRFFTGR